MHIHAFAWLVLGLASVLPIQLLITRFAVRLDRSAAINELDQILFKDRPVPQLEFVKSKYSVRPTGDQRGATRQYQPPLIISAVLFTVVSYAGILLLLKPLNDLFPSTPTDTHHTLALTSTFFWGTAPRGFGWGTAAQVSGFAFLGAYVAMLLYLEKSVLSYELNALAFMRATLILVLGTVVATVAYRALHDPFGQTWNGLVAATSERGEDTQRGTAAQSNASSDASSKSIVAAATTKGSDKPPAIGEGRFGDAVWIGVAFIFGASHQNALSVLMRRLNFVFRKDRQTIATEIVSVEIVDGVDSDIAFRLEENNIYDVQNLATANPLQLYVETPYGLMQCFDWVLQAQLCLSVGAEGFVRLKGAGLRTVFDLERAILSCGVPDDYRRQIGAILFADASPLRTGPARAKTGAEAGVAPTDASNIDPETVRHAVAVLTDDLHVHRLRWVWEQIRDSVGKPSDQSNKQWLYDVKPLPGEKGYPGCDCEASPAPAPGPLEPKLNTPTAPQGRRRPLRGPELRLKKPPAKVQRLTRRRRQAIASRSRKLR